MNEREIFEQALDHKDPVDRQTFLDIACGGDSALRARIDALLLSHGCGTQFLNIPAPEQLQAAASAQATPIATSPRRGWGAESENQRPDDEIPLGFLAPPRQPDSLGRIDQYEVLQVLGIGGFGIVFRAFDEVLQRVVAIKVLSPQMAGTSPARKRFLREARSSAQVRHENVVQVYAVGEQPLPFIVTEFIAGETLQQRLDRTGPLDVAEVLRIAKQIAEGLAASHATELIHRDIKPGNVLLEGGTQKVKITDFGLARAADDASISQSGLVAGTPMYMAPEQAKGETLDQRADLFSLGSVLYQMVSGRPPFRANGTLAVLKRVAEDTPRPIREIIPETPHWLCDIIAKLHSKNPDDRFRSAREVADLLGHCLTELQHFGKITNLPGLSSAQADTGRLSIRMPEDPRATARSRFGIRRLAAAAAILLSLVGVLGATDATGLTNVSGTVIRLFSAEGTLVVEVDDPAVSVLIDGSDIVVTGAGPSEIRLKPGSYKIEGIRNGKTVDQKLVTVTKNGKQVVRVGREKSQLTGAATEENSVAVVSSSQQLKQVWTRLRAVNPGIEPGDPGHDIEGGVVTGFSVKAKYLTDISPLRALSHLRRLKIEESLGNGLIDDLTPLKGMKLSSLTVYYSQQLKDLTPLKGMPLKELALWQWSGTDLTPLKGMSLTRLDCGGSGRLSDLTPLTGMPLESLYVNWSAVSDLKPLKGMPLNGLFCSETSVTDLTPLSGMKLKQLGISKTRVADLSPLRGMPLDWLFCEGTQVTDLSPLIGMPLETIKCDFKADRDAKILRSIKTLKFINDKPAAEFWKDEKGGD
jgi:eukaryotic-like serine/threonine-protein kinase